MSSLVQAYRTTLKPVSCAFAFWIASFRLREASPYLLHAVRLLEAQILSSGTCVVVVREKARGKVSSSALAQASVALQRAVVAPCTHSDRVQTPGRQKSLPTV